MMFITQTGNSCRSSAAFRNLDKTYTYNSILVTFGLLQLAYSGFIQVYDVYTCSQHNGILQKPDNRDTHVHVNTASVAVAW